MDERAALLEAIRLHPAEDTPRLVFADWLDEHDESAHAAFIRAQVTGAGAPGSCSFWSAQGPCVRGGLADLLYRKPWTRANVPREEVTGSVLVAGRRSCVVWHRGFIEGVYCSGALLARALLALERHPIRELLLSSPPPLHLVRVLAPSAGAAFKQNADNDPVLVRLLRGEFPGLVRAVVTDERPTKTNGAFWVVG